MLTCGFFNSLNGDRKYNAQQMAYMIDALVNDGVMQNYGEFFTVKPGDGLTVVVGKGMAWFNSTWTRNDGQMVLDIDAADVTLTRYDAVVLEIDTTATVRTNTIKIVKGTPASSPVKPVLTNTETVHQHPLAYLKITPGITTVPTSSIEVRVGKSDCPWITGILSTVSIDSLFQQWDGEFNTWFDNLQEQLSDNVVTNLQKQINSLQTSVNTINTTLGTKADVSTVNGLSGRISAVETVTVAPGSTLRKIGAAPNNSWKLCDGSPIAASPTSSIGQICARYASNLESEGTRSIISGSTNGLKEIIAYTNGVVFWMQCFSNGGNKTLYYMDNLNIIKSITISTSLTHGNGTFVEILDILYFNNNYYALGVEGIFGSSKTSLEGYFFICSSPTVPGLATATKKRLYSKPLYDLWYISTYKRACSGYLVISLTGNAVHAVVGTKNFLGMYDMVTGIMQVESRKGCIFSGRPYIGGNGKLYGIKEEITLYSNGNYSYSHYYLISLYISNADIVVETHRDAGGASDDGYWIREFFNTDQNTNWFLYKDGTNVYVYRNNGGNAAKISPEYEELHLWYDGSTVFLTTYNSYSGKTQLFEVSVGSGNSLLFNNINLTFDQARIGKISSGYANHRLVTFNSPNIFLSNDCFFATRNNIYCLAPIIKSDNLYENVYIKIN